MPRFSSTMCDALSLVLLVIRSEYGIPTHTFMTFNLTGLDENTGHHELQNVGGF